MRDRDPASIHSNAAEARHPTDKIPDRARTLDIAVSKPLTRLPAPPAMAACETRKVSSDHKILLESDPSPRARVPKIVTALQRADRRRIGRRSTLARKPLRV